MKTSKKQFIIYLIVAFSIAYVLEIIGSVFKNNGNEMMFTLFLVLAMFAPLFGAFVAKASFREMGWKPRFKGNFKLIVFSLLMPAICAILGAGIFYLIIPNAFDPDLTLLAQAAGSEAYEAMKAKGITPLMLILSAELSAITFAPFISAFVTIGEEVGWRGFMYSYLKERFGTTKGRIIGGIIWGAWHWPVMLVGGYEYGKEYLGAPVLGLIVFCIFTVIAGILLDHVYEKSGTIWLAALLHGAINANTVFFYTTKVEYSHLSILGPNFIGVISGIPLFLIGIYIVHKDAESMNRRGD